MKSILALTLESIKLLQRSTGHRWNVNILLFMLVFYLDYTTQGGPGSVVGIPTGDGLDGPGIESRWGRVFPHLSRPALGPTQHLYNGYRVFPGGKERPGRDAAPSPPSSAAVKERVELYLYSPYGPYGLYRGSVPVQGCTLPFLYNTGYLVSSPVSLEYTTQDIWYIVHFLPNTQHRISGLQSSVSRIYNTGYLVSSPVSLEYETQDIWSPVQSLPNTQRRISGLQSSVSRIYNTGYLVSSPVSREYTTQDMWSPVQCLSNIKHRISGLQSSVSRIYNTGYLVSSPVSPEYTTQDNWSPVQCLSNTQHKF